jgi:hypothetical protein
MGNTESSRNEKKGKEGSGKTAIIIIIGVIVILLLVIVIILLLKGKGNEDSGVTLTPAPSENTREIAQSSSIRVISSEEEAQTAAEKMRQTVTEGMFKCDMPTTWTFKKGGSEPVDLYVANHPDNTKPIYFDVYLEDTDELIYSSPVLKVDTKWTDIVLNKELEPGSYRAKVAYKLLNDEESQEVYSSVNFIVLIKIKD